MKRLSPDNGVVTRAPLSQADVAGAEQACTAIAVAVCATFLCRRAPLDLELCIRQGGALYQAFIQGSRLVHAKEVLDFVSPAWPVCAGDEHGFLLDDLDESLFVDHIALILTCGVFSMAVLGCGTGLVDSHPNPDEDNKAVMIEFSSAAGLVAYLKEGRFSAYPQMECSLCVVRKRLYRPPTAYPVKEPALAHARRLPPGFFYVFGHDTKTTGAKEFLVAGLEDFFEHYVLLDPKLRCHYDMALSDRPLSYYADLEFAFLAQNQGKDPTEMLVAFHGLVEEISEERLDFHTYDSTRVQEKESKHTHSHSLWFPGGVSELGLFMKRVEEHGKDIEILWVWRIKNGQLCREFFADMSVYNRDRCVRLPFSSKLGKNRPLLPLGGGDVVTWEDFFGALISPPCIELYKPHHQLLEQKGFAIDSGSTLNAIASAPGPIRVLANAVERYYKPESMRGFQMAPSALVTFSMIKHDCPICNDTHNNQVYVVCDLKERVMYAKCHADRSKEGENVPFPVEVGSLSLINTDEMQQGSRAASGVYPADSSTARIILGFARAIYAGSRRNTPSIPAPGSVAVHYDKLNEEYEVPIPRDVCSLDGGTFVLIVSKSKLTIRCKGKMCRAKGKRWDRPSHSATSKPVWNMTFLFPTSSGPVVPSSELDAEAFLAEGNLLKALGFDPAVGAPPELYDDRLKQIEEWAALAQKEAAAQVDPVALQVRSKAAIIRRILTDDLLETCYRECLVVAPDFVYPMTLRPRGPSSIATGLWIHLAHRHGYKRVEDKFYVPFTDDAGRIFYRAVLMDDLLTSVCNFSVTPNLCHSVMWNGRVCDDVRNLLKDRNHFPSLPVSKRYLGYANVVYDLEANVALTWDEVRADPSIMPFNFLDQQFPVEMLARAKEHCPTVTEVDKEVHFDGPLDFVPTPLFDGPLHDQRFSAAVIFWLYAFLGRMFHYTDRDGDNWEILPFLMGAPGSFKSSILSIVMKYLQEWQIGVIGTRVEGQFPLDGIPGTLMAFMPEAGGCTLDRDLLKQMISADPIRIAGKYKTAMNIPSWIIPLLFAGNSFLKMLDLDGSVERRLAIFAFLYMLRDGEGATDLAQRIFNEEGPLLLIKWNTIYWQIRRSVTGKIQSMLPATIREATRQAIMQSDSFKAFFAQQVVIEEDASVPWSDLWSAYILWCKKAGKTSCSVDPQTVEAQAMFRRSGCSFVDDHVQNARLRVSDDPPFQSAFQVGMVRRLLGCVCATDECTRHCRVGHNVPPPPSADCHSIQVQPGSTPLQTVIAFEQQLGEREIVTLEAWTDGEICVWLQ